MATTEGFFSGNLVGGKCYTSGNDAADAYFMNMGRTILPGPNGGSVEIGFIKEGGAWYREVINFNNVGTQTGYTSTFYGSTLGHNHAPLCDPTEGFFDGIQLGWGIALVLIASYAFVLMKRAAR
jgi:hypothetical protein